MKRSPSPPTLSPIRMGEGPATVAGSILTTAALGLMLAGCGAHKPKPAVTDIVYWTGWSGHELEAQQSLIDEFNRTHPTVHVRMLSQFGASGYQKVRIAFAGGATPDVMSTVWADELAAYADRGVLTPLDPYLRQSGRDVDREYAPGIAHMVTIHGHVYGLAVTNSTSFIAYNRDIFKSAGLDPNHPPKIIADLDAASTACTKHDARGDFVRYGFRPGGLLLWAYAFGGGWFKSPAPPAPGGVPRNEAGWVSGQVTANRPENVRALTWMASYSRRYDLKRLQGFQSTFGSGSTPNGPFYVGKVAMDVTGEWEREFTRRYAPNLNWGWTGLPCPPGGRPNATTTGGSVFVIPDGCKNKEAAWTFLNWISSPHAVGTFCEAIHNIPPLLSVCDEPAFKNDPLYAYTMPIANGPNSFGPPPTPIWPTYSREIVRAEERAVLGGEDPQRVLDDLQIRMAAEQARTTKELSE